MLATRLARLLTRKIPVSSIFERSKSNAPKPLPLERNNENEQHKRDAHGNTPLHLAARLGRTDLISKLLENKADLEARNNQGQTPLKVAISNYNYPSIQALHQHGACPAACGTLSGEEALALQMGQWWDHHTKTHPKESLTDALLTSKKPFDEIAEHIKNRAYSQNDVLEALKACLRHNKFTTTQFLLGHLSEDNWQNKMSELLDFALQHTSQKGLDALVEAGAVPDLSKINTDRDYLLTARVRTHLKQQDLLTQFSQLKINTEATPDSDLKPISRHQDKKPNRPF